MRTIVLNQRHQPPTPPALASVSGSVPPLIEQWRFPLGEHMAVLTITGEREIEPQDMDALLEISHLFKRSILKRHRERSARTAMPEYEI